MLSFIHFSSGITGEKIEWPPQVVVVKLATPIRIAVSSEDMLLGTTKGPPESPAQIPFPSKSPKFDPAQRNKSEGKGHSGRKGNRTYLNLSGF